MNCKPGDLAVVVNSQRANEGKLVTVLCASPWFQNAWFVRSLGGPLNIDVGGSLLEGNIEDFRLRPIRPGSEDTTTEREVEHAN